mgnify:CR=1 FL=1
MARNTQSVKEEELVVVVAVVAVVVCTVGVIPSGSIECPPPVAAGTNVMRVPMGGIGAVLRLL